MSTQVNPRQFTLLVGGTEVEVLPLNASRKLLIVSNNSTNAAIVRYKVGQHFAVATNAVQKVTFSGEPTSGKWQLTFGGQTTAELAHNVSAATVQGELEGLSTIGAGNVGVAGTMAAGFTVTFQGTLAAAPQDLLTVSSTLVSNALSEPTIQNVPTVNAAGTATLPTDGTFVLKDYLGNETAALAYDITTTDLKTALNALPGINGDVDTITQNGVGTWTITFGATADGVVPALGVGESTLTTDADEAKQVEGLYATPAPLAGTYRLMVGSETTVELAFDADAATIQTALTDLPSIGAGNLLVTGTSLKTGFAISYERNLLNTPMPPLTPYANELHLDANVDPQKRVPGEVQLLTVVAVPGVGLVPLTPAPYVVQVGKADVSITGSVATTTVGVTQILDGVQVTPGTPAVLDVAVPLGAVYVVSDKASTPVEVWEG